MNKFKTLIFFAALTICLAFASPPNPGVLSQFTYTERAMLLAGGWRTAGQLDTMSTDDKRNTLIVEVAQKLSNPISYFQKLDDDDLMNVAANYLFVLWMGWRDINSMKTMSSDDIRNTLIDELNHKVDQNISELQKNSTRELVQIGITWYNEEITVTQLSSCQFDLTKASAISQTPVALVSQKYNNTSNVTLQNVFTVSKALDETSSFSQDESNSLEFGVSLTVQEGIPEVESESGTVSFTTSSTQTVSYTNTSTVSRSFSESTPVSVPVGNCIIMVATVTQGTYTVPYVCKATTQTDSEYQVSGTYTFGDAYGLQVSQTGC